MMNDDNKEWLSALVDGELQGETLQQGLKELRDNPQLQSSWVSYHLIRDSLSSNLNDSVAPQLHQRISAALEGEPTILAPQKRRPVWVKQAAGLAIAASVAGVAVIGVQQMNGADSLPAAQPLAQQQEYIRMAPPATLVAEGKEESAVRSEVFDRYLVNHNEYSANSGIQGVLPYVRIVGHKVNQ